MVNEKLWILSFWLLLKEHRTQIAILQTLFTLKRSFNAPSRYRSLFRFGLVAQLVRAFG